MKKYRILIFFPFISIIIIGVVMVLFSNYKPSYSFNWDGIRTNIKDSILISEHTEITSGHGGMGVSTQN